jgi:MoaA/NifB/PqqE/SkfB family radical SAM enzyme
MILDRIQKIELEITSNCNAACPGCLRTQQPNAYKVTSFALSDLKRIFPSKDYINGKQFKFCGVLGDPALNKECPEMVRYLAQHGGRCQLSTNGAYQTADWWKELGEIGVETGNVDINFCIDGHKETNHIYRVNTVWKVLERNLKAYTDAGGVGTWIYIVFDHNEHELDAAREHAKRTGLAFATRTGMRNSYHNWVAKLGKKNNKTSQIITTTGSKQHSKVNEVKKLEKFISEYDTVDEHQKDVIVSSITCKFIHEGEFFISSDQRVWPCCFLWDSYVKNSDGIVEKLEEFGETWNSLKYNNIEEILTHKWFQRLLELSWNPSDSLHLTRCIKTCALHKAYQNEITIENS